jgi:hypothetical protein
MEVRSTPVSRGTRERPAAPWRSDVAGTDAGGAAALVSRIS